MKKNKMINWRQFSWRAFFLCLALGLNYEFYYFAENSLSSEEYLIFLKALQWLFLLTLPQLLALLYMAKRWQISLMTFFVSLMGGMFVIGWMATFGNLGLEFIWRSLVYGDAHLETWFSSLTAPFIEEPLKAGLAFFVAYLFKIKHPKQILFLGMSAGLGFQIVEDIYYLTMAGEEYFDYILHNVFTRFPGSWASHWLLSAIFTSGVYLIYLSLRQNRPISKRYWMWTISPIIIHFIWNSPLNIYDSYLSPISAVLMAINFSLTWQIFQQFDGLENPFDLSHSSF